MCVGISFFSYSVLSSVIYVCIYVCTCFGVCLVIYIYIYIYMCFFVYGFLMYVFRSLVLSFGSSFVSLLCRCVAVASFVHGCRSICRYFLVSTFR